MTADGIAEFKDIPVGVHKVIIPPFRDYKGSETEAKMIEICPDGQYKAYVEIEKTGLTVTKVKLEWPTPWIEDDTLDGMERLKRAKTEVSVTALLLRKDQKEREESDSEDIDEDSDEEWEQEFIYKSEEDTYELPLKGGHYMVVVRYPQLQQVHEHIFVSPLEDCNTVLHYDLELVQ